MDGRLSGKDVRPVLLAACTARAIRCGQELYMATGMPTHSEDHMRSMVVTVIRTHPWLAG